MTTPPTPAGWYPDPDGSGGQRYWDGNLWTEHRHPAAPPPSPEPVAPSAAEEPTAIVQLPPTPVDEPTAVVQLPPTPSEGATGSGGGGGAAGCRCSVHKLPSQYR